jgi:hypothetical protein
MTKPMNLFAPIDQEKLQNQSVAKTRQISKNTKNITTPIEAKSNAFNSKSQNDAYLEKHCFSPSQLQIVSFQKMLFSQIEYVRKKPKYTAPKLKGDICF